MQNSFCYQIDNAHTYKQAQNRQQLHSLALSEQRCHWQNYNTKILFLPKVLFYYVNLFILIPGRIVSLMTRLD